MDHGRIITDLRERVSDLEEELLQAFERIVKLEIQMQDCEAEREKDDG